MDVVITRTDFVPGPYANFANQILGLTDFISQAETEYALKGINVGSFVESDPKAVFFLKLAEQKFETFLNKHKLNSFQIKRQKELFKVH